MYGRVPPTNAAQPHLHTGRVYIRCYTPMWLNYLQPAGTAEASGKSLLCAVYAFKMEQHSSSVQHKRNLAAQQMVVDYELFNQLQQNNDGSNNLGLVKQQLNPGRPITIKLNSVKFYPRLAFKRHYRSQNNPRIK